MKDYSGIFAQVIRRIIKETQDETLLEKDSARFICADIAPAAPFRCL
jgi:hypothetical protein